MRPWIVALFLAALPAQALAQQGAPAPATPTSLVSPIEALGPTQVARPRAEWLRAEGPPVMAAAA
jgi:hypothetical protein